MEHGESYVIVNRKNLKGVRLFWNRSDGEWVNRGEASIYSERQLEAAEDTAREIGGEVVDTENI